MKKEKLMNFGDGLKPIKIGQTVLCTNGQSGSHKRAYESTVKTIGSKLVTIDNGTKFYLDSGREQSEYVSGCIFSSLKEYERVQNEDRIIGIIWYEMTRRSYNSLSIEQALEIAKI